MTTINVGDVRKLSGTFSTLAGVDTDPTTVTLKVESPDGTITSYVYGIDVDLTQEATGIYSRVIDLDESGHWKFQWIGEGIIDAMEEDTFYVVKTKVK